MNEQPPSERRVTEPKSPALPETGSDRKLFESMLTIVESEMQKSQDRLGDPKDAKAKRQRIFDAVRTALASKYISKDTDKKRYKLFESHLTAEIGGRGGKKTATKRATEIDFEEALAEDHLERALAVEQKLEAERGREAELRHAGESHD